MSSELDPPVNNATQLRPFRSTLIIASAGSVVCWLALPPVGWSLLAWIAPMAWLWLVRCKVLPGKRPFWALWVAGTLFWLLTVHWIRLPHSMNYLAWPVLAGYLGVYLPTFVALSRVGVHRLGLPLWIVAPIVWTGLDWLRGHLMTGFLMGSLAHTQVGFSWVIQIASLVGEYGVTFLVMLVAACLTEVVSIQAAGRRVAAVTVAVAAIGLTCVYGWFNINNERSGSSLSTRIALIQGNTLADWKHDPEKQRRIMDEHFELSTQAVDQTEDDATIDLIVWPETAFRQPLITIAEGYQPSIGEVHPSNLVVCQQLLADFVSQVRTAVLVGVERALIHGSPHGGAHFTLYNSSVLVSQQGEILGTYDKMHRVPFGEYIPFADWFPWLKGLSPLTGGIAAGESPVAMEIAMENDGRIFSVNICYESAVPHLIRRQVLELSDQEKTPDVLVNLTNDAWYWGSSELDLHLACSIFRAVEMRTPLVIAANGGLSAHIDHTGRLLSKSQRQRPQVLTETVYTPQRAGTYPSFYAAHGDWFAGACLLCCIVLAAAALRSNAAS